MLLRLELTVRAPLPYTEKHTNLVQPFKTSFEERIIWMDGPR